ncbi:MAG: hypothetical protein GVX78_00560 [Bacteroidetes bacterium]|jgi:hypothetical protein|nr:hypothetical protein [Bacteroidota bacterium]
MENNDKHEQKNWSWHIRKERMFRQLPLLYLIAFLALTYIFSVHAADRKLRKISQLEKEVQETRWVYMSEKAKLMKSTTYSRIENQVKSMQLKSGGQPPVILK